MKKNRIYSEIVDIDTEHTREFYNRRAKLSDSMKCPYTAVLLGDQSADRAAQWDQYEKRFLLSKLAFSPADSVLDIGCGMGRLAESLIPLCGHYTGVDFSPEMVKLAKRRCGSAEGRHFEFVHASFEEIAEHPERFGRSYTKLVIAGVCMYINDSQLEKCFHGVLRLLERNCTLYIEDTVAVQTRLTLDDIASSALKSNYDAIYRTPAEYNAFYRIFQENGFRIMEQDFFPNFDGDAGFQETDHYYTILSRTA